MPPTEKPLNSSIAYSSPFSLEEPRAKSRHYLMTEEEKAKFEEEAPYGRTNSGRARRRPLQPTALAQTEYTQTANEKRVEEALEVLKALQWREGKTVREFAEKWGVTIPYARHLCARAKKIASEEITDPELARATAGEVCKRIIDEGLRSKKFEHRKIVLEAVKQLTMLAPGVRAPTEHTIRVDNTPDDLPTLIEIAKRLAAEQETDIVLVEGDDGSYSEAK